MSSPDYSTYKTAFKGREMPFAYLDLDLLDQNIKEISQRAGDNLVRIASKSVRCRWVLDYLLKKEHKFQGLMCFTGHEAVWLSQQGFDDLLIAYPILHPEEIQQIVVEVAKGKKIYLMIDSPQHIEHLNALGEKYGTQLLICLDLDVSFNFLGLHFGTLRSPMNSVERAMEIYQALEKAPHLALRALMGYEGQIAGSIDRIPGQGAKAMVVRWLKRRYIPRIAKRREEVVKALEAAGAKLEIVNGGGTGSLESTGAEKVVTELTAGSGFYSPHLFDRYDHFKHAPAAGYAIEVVRKPKSGVYTAFGGGYVASGALGKEKLPIPHLPKGLKLDPNEWAGEVQTPLHYKGELELGDPVFMRHSKAGELCEHFQSLLLLRGGKVVDEAPTYRGEGKCFL